MVSTVIILTIGQPVNYFLADLSGTGVPSSFLCTLMSLQTSFLVFSSVLQTRLVSPAAVATVIRQKAITVAQQIRIIAFIIFPFRFQGVVVAQVLQTLEPVRAWPQVQVLQTLEPVRPVLQNWAQVPVWVVLCHHCWHR